MEMGPSSAHPHVRSATAVAGSALTAEAVGALVGTRATWCARCAMDLGSSSASARPAGGAGTTLPRQCAGHARDAASGAAMTHGSSRATERYIVRTLGWCR